MGPPTAGLKLWVKADSLSLSNNDPVSTWTDLSGNGRDLTQATAANRPLFKTNVQNGLPGILFDGSNDTLSSPMFQGVTQHSVFVVLKSNTTAGWRSAFAMKAVGVGYTFYMLASTNRGHGYYNFGYAELTDGAGTLNTELWTSIKTSAPLTTFRLNGVGQALTNSGANYGASGGATDRYHVGSTDGTMEFWNGYVFEVVVYESAVSDSVRDAVESYLIDKWGL